MAAVEVEEIQGGGLQTAKDLFSGAVGGVAQVLIGKCCSSARDTSNLHRVLAGSAPIAGCSILTNPSFKRWELRKALHCVASDIGSRCDTPL